MDFLRRSGEGLSLFGDGVGTCTSISLRALFSSVRSAALGEVYYFPPAYSLLSSLMPLGDEVLRLKDVEALNDSLSSLAPIFLGTPTPWFSLSDLENPERGNRWWSGRAREAGGETAPPLAPDAVFSSLCMLGVELELYSVLELYSALSEARR